MRSRASWVPHPIATQSAGPRQTFAPRCDRRRRDGRSAAGLMALDRRDPGVRAVLLPALRAARPDALLVQEWGVVGDYGRPTAGTLIVDVATIGDELVEAWEIKSAAD